VVAVISHLLTLAPHLLAGVTHLPPRRDPPGFFQFLEGRNGTQPGDGSTHPVVFWGILAVIFLINIATVMWAVLRRRARRREKIRGEDFKSYKPR